MTDGGEAVEADPGERGDDGADAEEADTEEADAEEADAEEADVGRDHLAEVPAGAGCTEIWDHLSEQRGDEDDG